MPIKHKHILIPGQRYQDSRHFSQNPKVPKNVMGFNNHAQRSTPSYYLEVDNPFKMLARYNIYQDKFTKKNYYKLKSTLSYFMVHSEVIIN